MDNIDKAFESLDITVEDSNVTDKKMIEDADANDINIGQKVIDEDNVRLSRFKITEEDRQLAVNLNLVPRAYKDAVFDVEKIKNNLRKQFYDKSKEQSTKTTYHFDRYISLCDGILTSLRLKKLPTTSYIIGAPNSFGKTSFVTECIITMHKYGFKTVPYITLEELGYLRKKYEDSLTKDATEIKEIMLVMKNGAYVNVDKDEQIEYVKREVASYLHFNYYDYMTADLVFLELVSQVTKVTESHELYNILKIRGSKGLPTIVTVSFSLDIYKKDPDLKEYVWDEILTKYKQENCYDRLYHVSSYYKNRNSAIENKGKVIDKTTGIIQDDYSDN